MFDLGIGEMVLIAVLVIVFVGPEGLPDLMRVLGRFYGQMRRASDDLRRTFNAEVARVDADRRREELRQRRLEREKLRAAAAEAAGGGAALGHGGVDEPAHAADEGEGPPMIPPDPRLPADAAPRAVPRPPTAPGGVSPRPRPVDAPEAPAGRPPAEPSEH